MTGVDPTTLYRRSSWKPAKPDIEQQTDSLDRNPPKVWPKRLPTPQIVTSRDLMAMKFAPVQYVIPGYVAPGCTILAGAPKLGKSWLVLEMALAKATGGSCLGTVNTPEAEDVLYLALEDNYRRLQSRMDRLMPFGWAGTERLHLATAWKRAHEGGLDQIRAWAQNVEKPRMVVVDVLMGFRAPISARGNAYEQDYNAVKALTELSIELGIAIVVVHHTRKGKEQADPFERVSGTNGLSGAADTTLILDRDGNGVTLYGRGRDIAEIETAVTFDRDGCRWRIEGHAAEVRISEGRKLVLDALKVSPDALTSADLAAATGLSPSSLKQYIFQMVNSGQIVKTRRGLYTHPDRQTAG